MLVLSVLRCPDAVPPETRRVAGGEFRIGRGPDNDWVMPDPERLLSKRHCVIAFRNGGWALADTSTNGTFVNGDAEPLGPGRVRELGDGDRIRFGAYEIEARIEQEALAPRPASGASPFDDPFGDDVFAPRPPVADTFSSSAFGNDPLFGGPPPTRHSVKMPARYDPLAPPTDEDFFATPTQPDHSPSFGDAFKPPPLAPKLIPDDDWDLDLPAAPQPPPQAAPPPAPAYVAPPPAAAAPAAIASPFAEPLDPPPTPPPPPASPRPAAPPARAEGDAGSLLDAFLAGAGMDGRKPEDPEAALRAMGAALRACVSGIRNALIARTQIKGEFRIEQTMIRASGNNPLKFSADDDDALGALLGVGRRTDFSAEAAIADALRDMRLHELATMVGMRDAVRALIERLDPASLRAGAEGGINLLPAQKKARAFEAYEKLHGEVTKALADDFDSVFGKSFARAYEAAQRDFAARKLP